MNAYEQEHISRIRPLLSECCVLLRKSGQFPLEKPGKLALYGNGARRTIKGGTGSGEVNSRFFVTAEMGLEEAGFQIVSKEWLQSYDELYEARKKEFTDRAAKKMLKNPLAGLMEMLGASVPEPEYAFPLDFSAEAAVYVLSRISGEGTDRKFEKGDICLTDSERRDIALLAERYERFMLVINAGGPVDISELSCVQDVLVLSQLGIETGAALADILLGKENPSGKLATTWTAAKDYPAVGSFGEEEENWYREGVFVGYRYFDSVSKTADYPFGFGLSYTEFSISDPVCAVHIETVTVTARVRNTGSRAGKEVVQLYVSPPEGSFPKPYQSLAAFVKTGKLEPGEEESVTLSFRLPEIASYREDAAQYVLEKGRYILRIGSSSVHTTACAAVELTETVVTRQVKNVLGEAGFTDWTPEQMRASDPSEGALPSLLLDAGNIPSETVSYDRKFPISEEAKRLSKETLLRMNVGSFSSGGGFQTVIGGAGKSVAGAAGESYNGLVMADGPAGLRLSRRYIKTEKGPKGIGLSIPESLMAAVPPAALKLMKKMSDLSEKRGGTVYEQNATAIPVGTAIAQSWNVRLAETMGDIVGDEMERFHVHLWLAPALNIHRDIRCGRNFEYFSEDPLISGKMAAAITRGVQSHKGCGVTIKHYAANNQELRRYSNDSRVSERAMREIYLRGFEIAIRECAPMALMTSYNLLNGTHTSEHIGLLRDILRKEWGYEGIVMTDWLISQEAMSKGSRHAAPQAWKIAYAGGDLVMPGSAADYENLKAALEDDRLSRAQLEINATRLLRVRPL